MSARQNLSPQARNALAEYRWLVEEFRVSVFAQELGTAQPVSPKRLDAQLKVIESLHPRDELGLLALGMIAFSSSEFRVLKSTF